MCVRLAFPSAALTEDTMTDADDHMINPQRAGVTIGEADVRRAQDLAVDAHRGQVDKAGLPYIGHPTRVVGYLENPTAKEATVAWLHDVVEDKPSVTLEYIKNSFGSRVAEAVDAITCRPNESKLEYYARVKLNPIALTVKAADLADNADPKRLQLSEQGLRANLEARYALARHQLGIGYPPGRSLGPVRIAVSGPKGRG